MKQLVYTTLFLLSSIISFTQKDTLIDVELSNSFESSLLNRTPFINYSYKDSTQTHDYSGNWDFDSDGKTDGLFFVGNGGAHLYFSLNIVLSSDGRNRTFSYLQIDLPLVGTIEKLKEKSFYPPPLYPQFVVHDFDSDGVDEVFIHIDKMTYPVILDELKKEGANSRYLLLDFKENDFEIRNFLDE